VATGTESRTAHDVVVEAFECSKPDLAHALPLEELRNTLEDSLGLAVPVASGQHRSVDASELGLAAQADTEYHLVASDEGLDAGVFVKKGSGQAKSVRLIVSEAPDYDGFNEMSAGENEALALLTACGTGFSDLSGHGKQGYQARNADSARTLGREAFAANFAEIMGFSLLRLRVRDVLAALAFLRDECGYDQIVLEGHGRGGIWALHAAVLDEQLAGVELHGTLWSYELTLRDDVFSVPHFADVARGSLLQYDLPQLCAALAPMALAIVGPVGSRGETFDPAGSGELAMIRGAYGNAASKFELS
jgi:hypothetical protein